YYIGTSPPSSQAQGNWRSTKPFTISNAPEGRNRIYIWLEDDSGNRDYQKNSLTTLRLDTTAPSYPANLDATPNTWTNLNTFTIDWTYPTEPAGDTSGLKLGAWYKVGSPPTSDTDGNWRGIRPFDVTTTEGQTTLYLWLEDNVGNIDYTRNSAVDLFLDLHPPMAPLNLEATPSSWSNVNSFMINWTNPTDDAGIMGVYYKLDAPPFANNDGVYIQQSAINNLTDLTVSGEGTHPIYVWLLDNANNIYYLNYSSTTFYYDITAPTTPTNVVVFPNSWTNINSFDLTWTNPSDLSGIMRVWYKFDNPPISDVDGDYVDADNISMLSNINVLKEGAVDIYIWLEDYAGNVNYVSYNTATLFYDMTPPEAPAVLISNPGTWTKTNSFTLSWTNLMDTSGIAGAYYRLDTPPASNIDGSFSSGIGINEITNVAVPDNGTYTVFVWLMDRAGNIDYNNYATKELYYDAVPPSPPENLTATPSDWTNVNSFALDWLNPQDVSRISSAFYKLGAPPRFDTDGFKYNEDNISNLANLQVYDDGSYMIYVWLQDYAGNFNYTQNASAELLYDVNAPQIIHSKVTSATAGVKITISAILTDEHTGIGAAYLYYKNRNDNLYLEVPMNYAGGDIYTAEIPAEDVVTSGLEYYLKAEDSVTNPNVRFYSMYGQTISKPTPTEDIDITVTIEDLTPPSIVHNVVTTGTFGVSIKISAIITDDASGVANASLFYKSKSHTNYIEISMGTNNPYMAEIPSQAATTAGIEYYIKAVDKALNVNTAFYGMYGQVSTAPNSTNDIDIMISNEDTTAPKITYGPVVSNITATTALILWITDEPANSKIYLGTTSDYNSVFVDEVYITFHNFIIYDLTPATTYHYQVHSSDPYGNGPAMSTDRIFTTTSSGQVDTDGDGIPDTNDQDDDNDGIPDDWEIQYGLDPKEDRDSEIDSDGDGYTNRKEYLEGSHPKDRTSTPITANDLTPPNIVHTAVTSGQAGKAIEISAIVTDNESGVKSVFLYFKPKSSSSYTEISMGTENPYTAEISGLNVNPEGLEYYIEAEDYAYTPNIVFFGQDGILNYEPGSDSDIDIMVTGKAGDDDEDDGGFLEDIGEPFGVTNPTTCLLIIILLILVLVAIVIGIWGARRRMAMAREREQIIKDQRLEPKDAEDDDLVIMDDDDVDWDGL
ncbi:MAG: fibronectin type III domain-containing protein, partial [Thermoplasmata archaeon]|nr:fibronectin type III domain-containing protein [Thermoplasmata archaeon]